MPVLLGEFAVSRTTVAAPEIGRRYVLQSRPTCGAAVPWRSDPSLRHEVLTLSKEDRHELANELYESLIAQPLDPAWERAWSRKIEQLVEDIVAGRAELIDADEVHTELRAALRDSCR